MSKTTPPKAVKAPNLTKQQISELCESIVAMGRDEGATPRIIGRKINMSSAEIDALRKESHEFDTAWAKASDFSLAYYEEICAANLQNKGFNAALSNQLLRANWPKTYEASTYKVASEKSQAASETGAQSSEYYRQEVDKLIKELSAAG